MLLERVSVFLLPRVMCITLRIHPVGVEIGQGGLVAELLERLRGLFVDKTTATSPPGLLCIERHVGSSGGAAWAGPRVAGETEARGAVEEYG